MIRISRRDLLLATGATVGAVALTARTPAQSAARAVVRVGSVGTDVSAEPFYAAETGIAARNGIEIRPQVFAGGGAIIDAIVGGALDAGFSNLSSVAAARNRELPIVVLAPATVFVSSAPITLLMRARGSKLRTGADLNGKTIAISTLKGELQIAASAWIDKNGGDVKSVRFLELPFPSMAAALDRGRVDAAMISEPSLTRGREEIERLGDAYGAIADTLLIGGYVATESWVRANRDTARRFRAAIIESARWANAHHGETAEILEKSMKLDAEIARTMRRATYGDRLSPDLIQPMLDAGAKYGIIKPIRTSDLLASV